MNVGAVRYRIGIAVAHTKALVAESLRLPRAPNVEALDGDAERTGETTMPPPAIRGLALRALMAPSVPNIRSPSGLSETFTVFPT